MLSVANEHALVDYLILEGWEQGCWLPDCVAKYSIDAASQRALFEACRYREPVHREELLTETSAVPETLHQHAEAPHDQIWIVATQRCDLIKGLQAEPVVTLIRATKWAVQQAKDQTRRSPYLYLLRIMDKDAWVADFREVIVVPKAALQAYPARQILENGDTTRRRFALALAQRTWRRPVPRDIQKRIQEPLAKRYSKKTGPWADFFEVISEFLVERNEVTKRLSVYAVLGDHVVDEIPAGKFFENTVLPMLDPSGEGWLDRDGSGVMRPEVITLPIVFRTYKLDLDYLSTSRGGSSPHY